MKSRNKDHKPHESIIGKIIYGFLLFMPLLAIGVTCAYAIFNKNAYQSYYSNNINQSNNVLLGNDNPNPQKVYYLQLSSLVGTTTNNSVLVIENFNLVNNGTLSQTSIERLNTSRDNIIRLQNKVNTTTLDIYYESDNISTWLVGINYTTTDAIFSFTTSQTHNELTEKLYFINSVDNSFLSEVFYYSIDKVQQSPLFNWAENSAIHTGMTATCNALNITTPFIPLLMTYWLIISVIYILYDIILVILHIFHNKIHQLEDSF